MNTTSWQRLSNIVYGRMDYLGFTQTDLEKAGGPSSAWVRKLKAGSGKPSARHARSLRQLSTVLGWDANTAWGLLTEDRTDWTVEALEQEARELVTGATLRPVSEPAQVSRPAQAVRALTALFQSDEPIQGLTDQEWDDLLSAIEEHRGKRAGGQGQRHASG